MNAEYRFQNLKHLHLYTGVLHGDFSSLVRRNTLYTNMVNLNTGTVKFIGIVVTCPWKVYLSSILCGKNIEML